MNAITITLYNLLKNDLHLPDIKAEQFVQALNDLTQADVKNSAMEYKSVIREDMVRLETNLRGEIKETEISLRSEIKETKVDIVKWVAGIFFALALMILGLYIKK